MILISASDDIIDIRDVIERIEELETELGEDRDEMSPSTDLKEWAEGVAKNDDSTVHDEAVEYLDLLALMEAAEGGGDEEWRGSWYYSPLIRDTYFKEHAQQLAEDMGAIKDGIGWPYTCIDWEQAANELLMDYTSIDFNGTTYYAR